jgi:transposase
LKVKDAAAEAKTGGGELQLSEKIKNTFLRRYDSLIRKADKLNLPPPPPTPHSQEEDVLRKKKFVAPTPRIIINRLHRRRNEILRFMTDVGVPFDNNGSERDLRMIKLQQKISGCFRTSDGARNFCRVRSYLSTARKHDHSLLGALERVINGKPLVFQ